ncbi:sigma-70 family RNA polymerase sigma factor [Candidatus Poribacteria bacterium]|nr:sigma-70 family RNA polymerase sigma factor [Candidatus Poribacteria bacterium]MYB65012.1 sigma-70 family RNA polymerase sigma factor [Candidatus Poribacteria bacterium]MYF56305.1 sigma-70 family RNA polymerase sigma factor [Candidatus Poribacteria bacterium]
MKTDDAELIQRVLDGNDDAFAQLMKKYQKPVQALAWRKIGDFHVAQEITQDTFLIVYKRLHTLKDHRQFAGWIYVIATRRCLAWLRKKRIRTKPLEDAETTMIHRDAYSKHVVEEKARTAVEAQREVVKKLLAKLKESERTVMTLHYLGEMTVEEISKFIGVSTGTIKSRLRRARNRLQKEETMIREALEHFQISPNLTDNVMQEISRIKPGSPSSSKPLVPWVVAASSLILIALMFGIGSEYLAHFQKPYNLDAQLETTIELVDVQIVQNLEVEPIVRNRLDVPNVLSNSDNNGQKPHNVSGAAQSEGEDMTSQKQQWIQATPIKGTPAWNLYASPDGELFVITNYFSVHILSADGKTWKHFRGGEKLRTSSGGRLPIAKWNNVLYFVPYNELFISKDDGDTWDLLYSWKEEKYRSAVELVTTEQAFYLAFQNGVLQSEDNGKTWKTIDNGLTESIDSFIEIQNTLFAGTANGLFRYGGDGWKRSKFPVRIQRVISVTSTDGKLYVAAGLGWDVPEELERKWGIFRSTDLGDSWKDITPTNAWHLNGHPPNITLIAAGDTLLAMEQGMVRSINGGDTWLNPLAHNISPPMNSLSPVAVAKNDTIYVGSKNGLHYSSNRGESWDKINVKPTDASIYNLIALKKTEKGQSKPILLYARVDGGTDARNDIHTTDDGGKSWNPVQISISMTDPQRKYQPNITQIGNYGDVLYATGREFEFDPFELQIYTVASDGSTLVPIQGMPVFSSEDFYDLLSVEEAIGASQFIKQVESHQIAYEKFGRYNDFLNEGVRGAFAVYDDTFFMEYNFKLFRWRQGDTEWYDTGLEETVELTENIIRKDLKLAVSGNTVCVGKRDGHLVISLDRGNNWIDLTQALPFRVNIFKEIIFVGTTVYVATDAGIITSDGGKNWEVFTNTEGKNLIMEHLAADGTILYGVTKDTGIYRLKGSTWKQIISETPTHATSLAVDGDTIYIGTENGMFQYVLDE